MQALDITKGSTESTNLRETFSKKLIGQKEGADALINIVETYQMGMSPMGRPAGIALFLGPTGTGKTLTVELLCDALFGDPRACLKIDCGEFQHSHDIAKLVGSPPGYLGHRETHPMFTQEALNQWFTEKLKLSFVFFDEIEKASDSLWNLLLGIMDKATLTLGDNRRVDFSQTVIVMTSNLGSAQMANATDGGIGFASQAVQQAILDSELDTIARETAKRKFSPEFFNRLDNVVVYKALTASQMEEILNIELGNVQRRFLKSPSGETMFSLDEGARKRLLAEANDYKKYGARTLKRTVHHMVTLPLIHLLASGQVKNRDIVRIKEIGAPEFGFYKIDAAGAGK